MTDKQDLLARRDLTLSKGVLRRLHSVGITAQPQVSLEHQHLVRRYVVRGIESGGAVKEIGRYISYCGPNGERLAYLYPLDVIGVNGVHAVVVAPAMVRIELFRVGRTCQLLITKHEPALTEEVRRPSLVNTVLFRGVNGSLEFDLAAKAQQSTLPRFWSRAGEEREFPALFVAAVRAATRGAICIGCSHAHYLTAPDVNTSKQETGTISESATSC
ncbi:MAG: hypothetical protein ACREQ5_02885 [Candidatus Dormibacteria bacterium]